MTYNYQGAIQAGANPTDVMNYMASQTGYRASDAVAAGAKPQDVMAYMSGLGPTDSQSGGIISPWFKASPSDTPIEAGLKTAGNIIPSLANTAAGVVQGFAGLPGTLAAIPGQISAVNQAGSSNFNPGTEFLKALPGSALTVAEGILPFLKPAIQGDLGGTAASFEENPVGNVAPIVTAAEGGIKAGVERGLLPAELGTGFDTAISRIGQLVTKPAGAVADFVGGKIADTARFGAAQATGLEPSTIKTVLENRPSFTPEAMSNTDRVQIAQQVETALNQRLEDLSDTGKGYGAIRNSGATIQIEPTFLDGLITKNTGLKIEGGEPVPAEDGAPQTTEPGTLIASGGSAIRDAGDVRALQNFYNMWKPIFDTGTMDPNEFLNMRKDLADLSKFERQIGKSEPLEAAAQRMRGQLNTEYRGQLPGMADVMDQSGKVVQKGLDTRFGEQTSEIKELRKGIIDRNGNLTDTAINRIANATGKGKDLLLERLERTSPGITTKIRVLKAVEDIQHAAGHKVGTYGRSAAGPLGVFGAFTGNVPLAIAGITEAILASPKVAVPILRAYGFSSDLVAGVLGRLRGYLSGVNNLPKTLENTRIEMPSMPEASRQGGFLKVPFLEKERFNVERYTDNSKKTADAFENSKDQKDVGKDYQLGSFGKASFDRKGEIKGDRFPESELTTTLKNVTQTTKASDDPKNWRYDNIAHIAKMPNGEDRVVYTRENKFGKQEIINWHTVSNPKYISDLKKFGIPTGTRTRILSLERSDSDPLNYGDNNSKPNPT